MAANPEQKLVLTLKDVQEVLNYLSTRPYAEVFQVIETVKKARTLETVVQEQNRDAVVKANNPPVEV